MEIEVGGDEDYIKAGESLSYTQDAMIMEELLDRIISIGKGKRAPKKVEEISKGEQEDE